MNKTGIMEKKRAAGILLPVFSLPSKYGIGAFSREAYEFVDFLEKAGQTYWQVLPMGPTSYGDSPYQSFSTFAGNPYFIDIDTLIEEGLLTADDAGRFEQDSVNSQAGTGTIDYAGLYKSRFRLLRIAFVNSGLSTESKHTPKASLKREFEEFSIENRSWLADYAVFMALKNANDGKAWAEWDEELRKRKPGALRAAEKEHSDEITFICFLQFMFFRQWKTLKEYAGSKGIKIIGDIPVYVAYDSADTWASPELFQLDGEGIPEAVAGCPPDAFARTGQLWGNPLYRWELHRDTGFEWWISRIRHSFEIVDVLRIDHFRGFDEYYSIPFGHPTAEHGVWKKGPGIALFDALKGALGERHIIAEDLGFLTPSVREMVGRTGFPGMKVLQFAFDSGSDNEYLPHNHTANTVTYTGTHDNDTCAGWYESLGENERQFMLAYLGLESSCGRTEEDVRTVVRAMIRTVMASVSDTAVIPMQDYLELPGSARINRPSILGGNWAWRMDGGALDDALADRIRTLTYTYGRL